MNYEFTMTKEGMFDRNGDPITMDDIIDYYLKNGGKVEREIKDTTIYTMNNGDVTTTVKKCEVLRFS
jgi:hypothetical protein